MIVRLECGCVIDDAVLSTYHDEDGRHYPIGAGPETFCKRCDLYRPCGCDAVAPPVPRVSPRPFRESDRPFVIDSWRNCWRNSQDCRRESPRAYSALFQDLVVEGVLEDSATRVLVLALEADPDSIVGWIAYAPGTVPTVHFAYVRAKTRDGQSLRRAGLLNAMIHLAGVRDRLAYTFRPAERPHPRDNRTLGIETALLDAAKRRGIDAIRMPVEDYLGRVRGR